MEISSVRGDDYHTEAWFLTNYLKPQRTSAGKLYRSEKSFLYFNCHERTVRVQQNISYRDQDGAGAPVEVKENANFDGNTGFTEVPPQTLLAAMMFFSCTTAANLRK
ncbi:hypothetical protein C3L29_035470 [Pseudomonas sp. MWU12-2534b]|nr:hypothetical protein C3L29_035470 [Pseudomonas sp. MWU12-2534b]